MLPIYRRFGSAVGAALLAAALFTIASCGGQNSVTPTAHPGQIGNAERVAQPAATASPIQLVPGTTIGTDVFPRGDTSTGGQGQTVNGIPCQKSLQPTFHHHVHLSLFVNGEQIAIPIGTGMKNPGHGNYIYHADCFYWLHTHDETGIIHMEAPTSRFYNLHDYFYEWGEPLSSNDVAGYTGTVTVFLNGVQQSIDPRTIQFSPYLQITLEVGSPVVTPPTYIFPPNYK
ncbi:MAG TPA: hypothetical protein VKT51_05690 [Candidatus Eremiobacteraceae bacterium]|nr:hypothetical protein [Candidatus Eremiobacteraceae bacterium]